MSSSKADGKPYDTSAMFIPLENDAWDYKANAENGDNHAEGAYIAVLMRVTDITPYASEADPVVYPYTDNAEGMEVVYFAINGATKAVVSRIYTDGDAYYSDESCKIPYTLKAGETVESFGWAALPLGGDTGVDWQPGLVYTYTLNYSNGVGLRAPYDPNPGETIISDKVLVKAEVATWLPDSTENVKVPRK